MGSFTKWLGAGLGWTFGGPIGGILGFVIGNFLDGFSKADVEELKRESYRRTGTTQSGDFEISLLILSSIVIKADGKVDKRELDFVRNYFVQMYGKERANHAFRLFKGIMKSNEISTRQICTQIRQQMTHASRLQLIHYLFAVAKADDVVTTEEVNTIHTIAGYLYINQYDFESIKAMFYDDADSAYKILEIEKTATDSEVKKAYRKMAKKFHPDKLQDIGEEHMKGAQEKFLQIQKAYERIQKERGMK